MNCYKFFKIATAAGIVLHLMFACSQDDAEIEVNEKDEQEETGKPVFQADPTVFYYIHTHYLESTPLPGRTAMVKIAFQEQTQGPDQLIIEGGSFYFLKNNK
jgi:hypothetical protein